MSGEEPFEGDRDLLAAEYALGLLEGAERSEAEALAASDQGFREAVASWSGRLAPLLDEVEPVQPPGEVWRRIEAALRPPAVAAEEDRPGSNLVSLRRKVALWRGFAAGATAIAASLALVLLSRSGAPPPPAPPAAPMVAMLESAASEARLVATYDPSAGTLLVAPAVLASAAGHEHELWLILPGAAPRPVALVRPGKPLRMKMSEAMRREMSPDATLAVSVEPVGGSPTGQPTGPVIASGKFTTT